MEQKFSALLSVYIKEKPEYFQQCLDSLLNQTIPPNEIVIVKDGPLNDALESVLNEYLEKNKALYKIVALPENRGLGLALAEGLLHCSYELVARMDTDDICRLDRFEKQLAEFEKNPTLDICGSHIAEFEESIDKIVATRTVPLCDADIKRYQKRRDGFNHVSVMFKKSTVLKAGNYQSCLLMEDTLLWVHMFQIGAVSMNIDETLVYVRIGKDMYERRGGLAYFKKYKQGRKMIRKTGYISFFDYHYTLFIQFIVAIMPNKLRGWFFKKVLHR